jgi:soluble lytic murein transglycosylase
LMQLMPATAALLRRKLPEGAQFSDLTVPQNNILLGSTYLKDMKDYFRGELTLAIMAYNAGPGNVRKFLRTVPATEFDEFVEDIPFSETKGYIKRVFRTMHVYGHKYRDPYFEHPRFSWNPHQVR